MANLDLEATGVLFMKGEVVQRTETFKIVEFALEIAGERFTSYPKFQLTNDKCALIESANIGDTITVKANLNGRKYEKDGKTSFFNSVDAWKIEVVQKAQPGAAQSTQQPAQEEGNLPF